MKHLKIPGLTVMAVAALMAFSGNASATVLTSPAGTEYTGTLSWSLTGSLLLQGGFAELTCTASTMSGTLETNTTSAGEKLSTLTYSNCGSATVDVLKTGSLSIAPNGTVSGSGTETTFSVFGTSCVYGTTTNTTLGTLTGGTTASLQINASSPKIAGGFACANPAKWTGKYTVTTPDTLLVDSETSAPPVLTSPSGTDYTGSYSLSATESLLLEAGFADITCTESLAAGKVEVNSGTASGKLTGLAFASCGIATVEVLANGSLEVAAGGAVTGRGTQVTTAVFGTSCVYGTGTGTSLGTLKGGTPATLQLSANLPKISGGFLCANPAKWTGKYAVTTPSTLVVD
jgi:hypothetical protein